MSYEINDAEFKRFSALIYDIAGITLTDAKKVLLTGRLSKRLTALDEFGFTVNCEHLGSFGRRKITFDVWNGEVSLIHIDHRKTTS